MLDRLTRRPPDPILQLLLDCQADPNPEKVDLSVGVYKDEQGVTPVMPCVREAQLRRVQNETTKTYTGIAGEPRFNELIPPLALGANHPALADRRLGCVMTPGGSGALRIAAELIADAAPGTRVWLSDPSWANHHALFGNSGLQLSHYPYYDRDTHELRFDAMCETLRTADPGDVVVIHGSCHNPCGADLTDDQWRQLTTLMRNHGLLPVIDVAYHGIADAMDRDSIGWRYLTAELPEALLAYSCSKSFGIYRERTGALLTLSANSAESGVAHSNVLAIVRQIYSVPPAHGAALVSEILADPGLRASWETEVEHIRNRIIAMRALLADALTRQSGRDFSFIARERGMFSYLGLAPEQVVALRERFSVYIIDSSRISVAGITERNVDYVAQAVAAVLG